MRTLRGTVFGSGVGVVVLKPLKNALADGDPIRAVIRGSAVNNDGASKSGFTAPSAPRQAAAIRKALAVAASMQMRLTISRRTERARKKAIRSKSRRSNQPWKLGEISMNVCAIGSVKGNIGHADAASGVAGLIKTVLALEHEALPPTRQLP